MKIIRKLLNLNNFLASSSEMWVVRYHCGTIAFVEKQGEISNENSTRRSCTREKRFAFSNTFNRCRLKGNNYKKKSPFLSAIPNSQQHTLVHVLEKYLIQPSRGPLASPREPKHSLPSTQSRSSFRCCIPLQPFP